MDLSGRTALVTGATDGIGRIAARRLGEAGAHVIVHGRRQTRCVETVKELQRQVPRGRFDYFVLDLSELERIRGARSRLGEITDRLDVLINNAGVGPGQPGQERELSAEGYELRFAVNHLAAFALTRELLPLLGDGAHGGDGADGGDGAHGVGRAARIVNVASAAQSPVDLDDPMMERDFDPMRAYSRSKLAMVMFTVELAERLGRNGVTANSLHPGSLLNTKMVRETFGSARGEPEEGAENELFLAGSPELEGVSGAYFCERSRRHPHEQAADPSQRRRLWELSEELSGFRYDFNDEFSKDGQH